MARSYGTIYLSLDGELVSVKGTVTMNLSGGERTFEANMDGTVHTRFTRAPKTAEISAISGVTVSVNRLLELFRQCGEAGFSAIFDLSGDCATGGTTIHFIDAQLGGSVTLDAETGEITGIVIAAQDVRVTETS